MKILYVIGTGSTNDNAELRYSLRMLDAHGANVDDVIICGTIPSFIGPKAIAIEEKDPYPLGKHWNMTHKIITAINKLGLTEDILFSSDDHFLFRDADMDAWPRYTVGDIYDRDTWVNEHKREPGRYQRSMIATRQLLMVNNCPIVNCIRHVNMHIDCSLAGMVARMMGEYQEMTIYGFEPMLVFNNLAIKQGLVKKEDYKPFGEDVKCKSFTDVEQTLNRRCHNMFSVYDTAFNGGNLMRWFKKNYPNKSRWEK